MKKNRILAYGNSRKLDATEISSICAGTGTTQQTQEVTYTPDGQIDIGYDVTID